MAQNPHDSGGWYSPDTPNQSQSNSQYGFPRDGSSPRPGGEAPSPRMNSPYRAPGSSPYAYTSPYRSGSGGGGGKGKVIAIVLLAVALAAALLILIGTAGLNANRTGGGQRDIFGDRYGGGDSSGEPGNYQDYFSEYYGDSDDEVSGVFDIPRAETGGDVSLALQDHAGLQELSLQQVYTKIIPSVVGITATMPEDSDVTASWGTGIIIASDGYIITNAHVIDGASSATVTLSDNTQYDAKLVGADAVDDIAVLKIDAAGLTAAAFGDLSGLAVGDSVVAIGNPLGEDYSGTMTNGIISAIDRNVDYDGYTMTLLQTNAAINEGNSGGPLVNMYGQVIGLTNMKMMSYYTTIEGIGFAIPATSAAPTVDALIRDGAVKGIPALGITCIAVDKAVQSRYGIPAGVYVSDVIRNSDAYTQGMRRGDIITACNGEPVTSTDDIDSVKEGLSVGDTLSFTIYRDGETIHLTAALVDRSELYGG